MQVNDVSQWRVVYSARNIPATQGLTRPIGPLLEICVAQTKLAAFGRSRDGGGKMSRHAGSRSCRAGTIPGRATGRASGRTRIRSTSEWSSATGITPAFTRGLERCMRSNRLVNGRGGASGAQFGVSHHCLVGALVSAARGEGGGGVIGRTAGSRVSAMPAGIVTPLHTRAEETSALPVIRRGE